jgi:hypothetical protein
MVNEPYECPVLLVVFNRPDHFRSLIKSLRHVSPSRIYVAADGPRDTHADDERLCQETRGLISQIDWPCEIKTRFLDSNHSLKKGVSSAIRWFFENEVEGIIIEDDCHPAPEFFNYCRVMLDRYRHTPEVMHISGCNLGAPSSIFGGKSYDFTSIPMIWGWAAWRRSMANYDIELDESEVIDRNQFRRKGISLPHAHAIRSTMLKVARGKINTWAYQWLFMVMKSNGLSVIPRSNLITNVGFGAGATTTIDSHSSLANLKLDRTTNLDWGQIPQMSASEKIDKWMARQSFGPWPKLTKRMFKDMARDI